MAKKYIIVDGHEDLAFNMIASNRDYRRTVAETRQLEIGTSVVEQGDDTMLGVDAFQAGQIAFVFSTLFAAPFRSVRESTPPELLKFMYKDRNEANQLFRNQIDAYRKLIDEAPEFFKLIETKRDYIAHLKTWQDKKNDEIVPTGLTILMESAEAVRHPDELFEWWDLGVRMIGPAWIGTRFCGGTGEPGGLTDEGHDLLAGMVKVGFGLDLSHMDQKAAYEALDVYDGEILCSHLNAKDLIVNARSNRHFEDDLLVEILKRGGVIGVIPFNRFLDGNWKKGDQRLPMEVFVHQIDHICQLASDATHVGIGSDFDGGFGLQQTLDEFDSIADLQKIPLALERLGYSENDIMNIMGMNWCRKLEAILPE